MAAENYSKMSDDELLAKVSSSSKPSSDVDYSKMSDDDLLAKVNGGSTAADLLQDNNKKFNDQGGWKSYGKGILSSLVDVPNNIAQGVAYTSEKLDNLAGVDPLITQDQVKGNWFDKHARELEEPNVSNYMGRMTGDIGVGAAIGAALPGGATTLGKIGYDALSGGLSGLATGGAPGAAGGAIGGAAISGLGRLAGLAPKNVPTKPFVEDLKRVYGSGAAWAGAGMAGSAMAGMGMSVPGFLGGAAALPGVYTAFRHIPQGIANGALRYGSSGGGAMGGGLLSSVMNQYNNNENQQPYVSPVEKVRNSKLANGMGKVMDYGTRGGYINKYFRPTKNEQ